MSRALRKWIVILGVAVVALATAVFLTNSLAGDAFEMAGHTVGSGGVPIGGMADEPMEMAGHTVGSGGVPIGGMADEPMELAGHTVGSGGVPIGADADV